MPKTYIKVRTSAGKQYHALLGKMISNRSFKTATKAEEYAAIVKDRYQRLKRAENDNLCPKCGIELIELGCTACHDGFSNDDPGKECSICGGSTVAGWACPVCDHEEIVAHYGHEV